ncbi:MAG: hypothetical protein IJW82_07015 [Clostridia bacterium]|nr:hypothetical protein [Clostridia bacterium]
MSRKLKGKIGYVSNRKLRGLKHISGGHYVYINKINNNGTCNVNVFTSLENKNNQLKTKKIRLMKKGNIYNIPIEDSNFTRWTGIKKGSIRNVKISDIKNIGSRSIKTRHKFFIGKFLK